MIAEKDYTQLLTQATVKLVGASQAGLKGELFDVLAEFFNDSSCWTQCVTVNAIPDRLVYPLQVSEGQIVRLVGVGASENRFIPALMPTIGELILKNAPNAAETYYAEVVTNVSLPTARDQVPIGPDWVLPVWHLGILDGLLGKMMAQPSKSFSNVAQSAYHLKRFRDAIARARVSKLRANTNGTQAWRFPQQFRSNGQQGGVPGFGGGDRSFG